MGPTSGPPGPWPVAILWCFFWATTSFTRANLLIQAAGANQSVLRNTTVNDLSRLLSCNCERSVVFTDPQPYVWIKDGTMDISKTCGAYNILSKMIYLYFLSSYDIKLLRLRRSLNSFLVEDEGRLDRLSHIINIMVSDVPQRQVPWHLHSWHLSVLLDYPSFSTFQSIRYHISFFMLQL